MPTRRQLLAALVASASSTAVVGAKADTWPSRPVRVIVPYPPGGSSDITARFVAESVSRTLGQRFFIDNRPGAGGNVGMEAAAQSSPDGYTVVLGTTAHAINMTLFKNLNYNTLTSFIPVALLTEMPLNSRGQSGRARQDDRGTHRTGQSEATGAELCLVGEWPIERIWRQSFSLRWPASS